MSFMIFKVRSLVIYVECLWLFLFLLLYGCFDIQDIGRIRVALMPSLKVLKDSVVMFWGLIGRLFVRGSLVILGASEWYLVHQVGCSECLRPEISGMF